MLIAFQVVRAAFVQSDAVKDPSRAARIWPGHPAVILDSGLAEVGARAAASRPIDPALVHRLLAASAKAPLAPEPFLVRGVEAGLAGNGQLALQAFLAARDRNPRAIAARYFLADHYLKVGQTGPGLAEISVLARLVPQSLPNMAPFLAEYARSPGAAPQVKDVLQTHPQLEPVLLNTLAADAANADLIMTLWSGRGGDEARAWQGLLLAQLVESGRFDMARTSWSRFTGFDLQPDGLFDPDFKSQALPPFGWTLVSGPAGVAEAEGAGRLHILYYGRDNLVLASQTLTLKPGRYRLSMKADMTSPSSKSLAWTVDCLPALNRIALVSLERGGPVAGSFTVPPANCQAQRLDLYGTAPEFPEQADVTISKLRLQPEASP